MDKCRGTGKRNAAIAVIQNSAYRVEFSTENHELRVTDLKYGGRWHTSSPFQLVYGGVYSYDLGECCRTSVTTEENRLRFRLDRMEFFGRFRENPYRKPDPGPELEFEFSIGFRDDCLVFRMEPVRNPGEEPLKVRFANGLLAIPVTDAGEAVLPCGFGGVFRLPRRDRFSYPFRYTAHHTAIPVYGLLRKQAPGLAVRLLDYTDQTTVFSISREHAGRVSFDIDYDVIAGPANESREFLVRVTRPGEDYNGLAKWYRSCLIREKRFVTYQEKIARSPEAEKLIGCVVWKHNVYARKTSDVQHTYSLYMPGKGCNAVEGFPNDWNADEIFRTAQQNGFDRVCVYNTGWNFLGFDSGYPVRLPPNPERGTEEEFQKAAAYARSLSADYIFSVHDNYQDTYRNSPEDCRSDLCRDENNTIRYGGIWRGGRARLLCTHRSMKYARRDIPRIVALTGRGSIYVDVFGCSPLMRCFDPHHPMKESEDLQTRKQLLAFLADQFGSVATEGAPADYFADVIHMGAFCSFLPLCADSDELEEPPLPIPFWQLVYHDSVLNYTCEAAFGPQGAAYQSFVALYNLLPTAFDTESLRFSHEMRSTYTSELLSHEFIGPVRSFRDSDGKAAFTGKVRTRYADGTSVEAEFADNRHAQYRILHV